MIVECRTCRTRFRLDEAKVSARGAKVRCSRCKTAFVVQRPGASPDEVVEEVVAEATSPGASRAPEASEDLFETAGAEGFSLGSEVGANPDQWEFDEAPSAAPDARREPEPVGEAPAPADAGEAKGHEIGAADFDSLGSPEDWDLLSGSKNLASQARFEADPPQPAAALPEDPGEPPAAFSAQSGSAALVSPVAAARRAVPAWTDALREAAHDALQSGAWLAAAAVCAAGIALALTPIPEAIDPAAPVFQADLRGERVEVRVRRIESATGGALVIAGGRLPASAGTSQPFHLEVGWLDANGAALSAERATAGPPLPMQQLRELSIERIRAEHTAHALELVPGGPFEAAFADLPPAAASISLAPERVPVSARPDTQTEGAPTASSPPAAPPSSE